MGRTAGGGGLLPAFSRAQPHPIWTVRYGSPCSDVAWSRQTLAYRALRCQCLSPSPSSLSPSQCSIFAVIVFYLNCWFSMEFSTQIAGFPLEFSAQSVGLLLTFSTQIVVFLLPFSTHFFITKLLVFYPSCWFSSCMFYPNCCFFPAFSTLLVFYLHFPHKMLFFYLHILTKVLVSQLFLFYLFVKFWVESYLCYPTLFILHTVLYSHHIYIRTYRIVYIRSICDYTLSF